MEEKEKTIFPALAKLACASGCETRMCERIRKFASKYADEVCVDPMLDLIAFKQGKSHKKTLLFSAHTDIGGFVVTYIGDDGKVYFSDIAKNDPKSLIGKSVVFANGAKGTLAEKEEGTLFADIGAQSKEEAYSSVSLFEPFTLDGKVKISKSSAKGAGLDAYVGCAALCMALKDCRTPKYDTVFVFASQNELGQRGALAVANLIRPDLAVSVGVCDKANGGGTYITVKDGGMIYQTDIVERAMKLCKKHTLCAEKDKKHDSAVYTKRGAVSLRLGIGCGNDEILFSDLETLAGDLCVISEKGW